MLAAVLAQTAGALIGAFVWKTGALAANTIPCIPVFVAAGTAAILGRAVFRLPNWWLLINGAFIPAVAAMMTLDLPPWLYLGAFILTAAVFWNVRSDRVPLYLTNSATWRALSEVLTQRNDNTFVDLGSGLSGTLRYLALHHPNMTFAGVESAPLPAFVATLRQSLTPLRNLRQERGDMWSFDLSGFDVVYCFLSPAPMARLYDKARAEMKPGSILISNSFAVPDCEPDEEIFVDDRRGTRLLIWRF